MLHLFHYKLKPKQNMLFFGLQLVVSWKETLFKFMYVYTTLNRRYMSSDTII